MKVSSTMIHRELRLRGRLIRLLLPCFTEKRLRHCDRLLRRVLRGRWLGKQTVMEEISLPRQDGSSLRLCLCRSRAGVRSHAAGLLWLHGGGYAMGLPEQDFSFIDLLAGDGACVALLPDYRLSTSAPFPAALEDCYAALLWMKKNASRLGIRPDQLFVGGESAGGGLAAALCLYARDHGQVSVAFQMPLYPMLDCRNATASAIDNNAPAWNAASNEAAWRLYLGDSAPSIYSAPALAQDLANMPPLCTYVGTIDPFHDETAAYVSAMASEEIAVHFREYPGCFHGFDILCPGSSPARQAAAFLSDSFQWALAHCFAPQPPSPSKKG